MASSGALGASAVPYIMLDQDRTDDIAAYATAKVKLAATFGRNADAPVSIRFQGRTYDNLSARATIAHSRYRQSVRSEEHTSELQSLMRISYAVFCSKKKKFYLQAHSPHIR